MPIYCFEKVGCVPLLEGYRAVVKHLDVDAVVLIDGGTDSLMKGDEAGLGTPEEDFVGIAAVDELDVEKKYLVCLGFGVDSFHGVCHAHAFEAVADFDPAGSVPRTHTFSAEGDAGSSTVCRSSCGGFRCHAGCSKHRVASILSAIDGHYGDHHCTARTKGSVLWINPLMTLYWCFRLGPVARRIIYLDEIKRTQSMWDIVQAIDTFRENHEKVRATIRSRTSIPDVSLAKKLTR